MESKGESITSMIRLRILLMVSCFLLGLLAGETIERIIVQLPAWKKLNIGIWGEFSRHADLGNGLIVYPFEALGSFVCLLTTSIILFAHRRTAHNVVLPVIAATVFSFIGLILTFLAAPVMLSVRNIGNDPAVLNLAFNEFYYWSFFRGIAQILSFAFCIWAVGKTFSGYTS